MPILMMASRRLGGFVSDIVAAGGGLPVSGVASAGVSVTVQMVRGSTAFYHGPRAAVDRRNPGRCIIVRGP